MQLGWCGSDTRGWQPWPVETSSSWNIMECHMPGIHILFRFMYVHSTNEWRNIMEYIIYIYKVFVHTYIYIYICVYACVCYIYIREDIRGTFLGGWFGRVIQSPLTHQSRDHLGGRRFFHTAGAVLPWLLRRRHARLQITSGDGSDLWHWVWVN